MNLASIRTYAQPLVRAMTNSPMAEWLQQMHPLRLQYELFSDANPTMAWVGTLAEQVRRERRPAAADKPALGRAGDRVAADRPGARPLARHERGTL